MGWARDTPDSSPSLGKSPYGIILPKPVMMAWPAASMLDAMPTVWQLVSGDEQGGAGKAGEHGWRVVVSRADHALSAGEKARAGVDCRCDLRFEFFELRGGGERADLGFFARGVADLEGVHGGDEARFKFAVD